MEVIVDEVVLDEPVRKVVRVTGPKFLDDGELSLEQLTDPDYSLKQLEKLNKGKLSITCSKCHHCH